MTATTHTTPRATGGFDRDHVRRGAAAMFPLVVSIAPLGLLVGAAVATHPDRPAAFASTWLVYGASAHLALLDLTATGAGTAVVVVTCLLIQARLVVYAASMSAHWRAESGRFKALMAATIVDPSFAIGDGRYREPGSAVEKRSFFVGATATLWVGWTLLIVVGAVAGARFAHVAVLQVALPVCLVPMVAPALAGRPGRAAVVTAATVAVIGRSWPSGLGLVAAIVAGAVAGAIVEEQAR
jgi:predicted branched-subunit amino acid permease